MYSLCKWFGLTHAYVYVYVYVVVAVVVVVQDCCIGTGGVNYSCRIYTLLCRCCACG